MKSLNPVDLNKLIDNGVEIAIIDIRESYERLICEIPNSDFIRMNQIIDNSELLSKDKMTVIYCHHGIRSYMLIQHLEAKFGFKNLHNLEGGINRWAEQIDNSLQRY